MTGNWEDDGEATRVVPSILDCDGLNMLVPGNGTIRCCDLVGVGVALEEVCHCGHGL